MDETLRGVREFHEAFNIPTPAGPSIPTLSRGGRAAMEDILLTMRNAAEDCHQHAERAQGRPEQVAFLRLQLIQEELSELAEAFFNGDIVEALDALTDLLYVLDGTYLSLGLHELKLLAHREVQRSNMTKLGEDGQPLINAAGRVVKGPNFEPPNLKKVLYTYLHGGRG